MLNQNDEGMQNAVEPGRLRNRDQFSPAIEKPDVWFTSAHWRITTETRVLKPGR
jgi:hypothetical protein